MPDKTTTTARMDEHGRVFVPSATRKTLGIYGEEAHLEIEVRVKERAPLNFSESES